MSQWPEKTFAAVIVLLVLWFMAIVTGLCLSSECAGRREEARQTWAMQHGLRYVERKGWEPVE